MKFIYFLVTIVIIISLPRTSWAFFISQGTIKNSIFVTGIWGPPSAPNLISPITDYETNQDQIFEWMPSLTASFLPVSYTLEIYDANPEITIAKLIFSQTGISETKYPGFGGVNLSSETYWWRVKAVDRMNLPSEWSRARKLIIDKNTPQTTMSVQGSLSRLMDEQIDDGTFEKYTNNLNASEFNLSGEAGLWKIPDSYEIQAFAGSRMLIIGNTNDQIEGNNLFENNLGFVFPNNSKTISFYYNYYSADEYPFDDPGFIFSVNGNPIFQVASGDLSGNNLVKSTGWKQFFYDISGREGDTNIEFFAGNTEDNFRQSWVYLDEIKTGLTAVNKDTKFTLVAHDNLSSDAEIKKYYCHDRCEVGADWKEYMVPIDVVAIDGGAHNLYFYGIDKLGNKEATQIKPIFIDTENPSKITDLSLKEIKNNAATLIFGAPFQNQDTQTGKVDGYEIKISQNPTSDSESEEKINTWWNLATAVNLNLVPNEPGILEELLVESLDSNTTYYLAVKSFDGAANYSPVSNIFKIKTLLQKGDVLINEVLYDVIESPEESYEWTSLYNTTNEQVDLTDWYIADNSGSKNLLDAVIEPNRSLVITPSEMSFRTKYLGYGGSVFQINEVKIGNGLANSGDHLKLFDKFNYQWDEVGWENNTLWGNCQLEAVTGQLIKRKNLIDTDTENDWTVLTN